MVEVTQALAFMEQQYAQFVALAHDGRTPYRWQFRLMRYVVQEGRWLIVFQCQRHLAKPALLISMYSLMRWSD